jgi:hypothetical protein
LALALGDNEMFDANMLTRMRIGPTHNISGGKYAWRTGFEEFVDQDTPIDRQAGMLCQAD